MKKLTTYILYACSILAVSCSGFLDQDNRSNIAGKDYYQTASGYESLSNAAYSSLRSIYGNAPWLFEGGTDLFASGRTSVQVCNLYGQNYSSAEENVRLFYREHYQAIALANELIYWGKDQSDRAGRVAEARGLRAFYYLNLVQQFGGVPLVLERSSSPLVGVERASAEDVLKFVIDEFKDLASESSALQEDQQLGVNVKF